MSAQLSPDDVNRTRSNENRNQTNQTRSNNCDSIVEGDRIAIESQSNGRFLGNIRFPSIRILRSIDCLHSIGSIDCLHSIGSIDYLRSIDSFGYNRIKFHGGQKIAQFLNDLD